MKISQSLGVFEHIRETEYTPTVDELKYWYSGTNAGIDPNNPYKLRGMSVSVIKMKPANGEK